MRTIVKEWTKKGNQVAVTITNKATGETLETNLDPGFAASLNDAS